MRIRAPWLVPVATAVIYACSGSEPEPVGPPPGYEDVLLEGQVTDEAFAAFVQALESGPPEDVPTQAAVIDWPADGERVPRNPPQPFCWHFGATAGRDRAAPARWAALDPPPPRAPDITGPLRALLGPPRNAFAHGDPYGGPATWVVFSIERDPQLVRVFTSHEVFVPSQAVWDDMAAAAAGKPITIQLVSAYMEQDRVAPDGGPFAGDSIAFTIAP